MSKKATGKRPTNSRGGIERRYQAARSAPTRNQWWYDEDLPSQPSSPGSPSQTSDLESPRVGRVLRSGSAAGGSVRSSTQRTSPFQERNHSGPASVQSYGLPGYSVGQAVTGIGDMPSPPIVTDAASGGQPLEVLSDPTCSVPLVPDTAGMVVAYQGTRSFDRITCSQCKLVLRSAKSLRKHLDDTHSISLRIECGKCSTPFEDPREVGKHYKSCCSDQTPRSPAGHECESCSRVFPTGMGLTQHIRHAHKGKYNALLPRPKRVGYESNEMTAIARMELRVCTDSRRKNQEIQELLPNSKLTTERIKQIRKTQRYKDELKRQLESQPADDSPDPSGSESRSSTNNEHCTLSVMAFNILLIATEKQVTLRTLPCGTPSS